MAFTYSGIPGASDRDGVRYLIQDTDPAMPLQSDEELDFLLSEWMPKFDSIYMTASKAAGVISRKFAGVVNVSADGVSVNVSDLADKYATMATRLRTEYQEATITGGVVDLSNLMWDSEFDGSIAPLSFSTGMHDNRWAGQQEFGGYNNRGRGDYPEYHW